MAAFEGLKTVRLEPKDQNAQESQVFLRNRHVTLTPPKIKNKTNMVCVVSCPLP